MGMAVVADFMPPPHYLPRDFRQPGHIHATLEESSRNMLSSKHFQQRRGSFTGTIVES